MPDPRIDAVVTTKPYGSGEAARDWADAFDAADRAAGIVRVDTRNPDPGQKQRAALALSKHMQTYPREVTAPVAEVRDWYDAALRAVLAALAAPEDTP